MKELNTTEAVMKEVVRIFLDAMSLAGLKMPVEEGPKTAQVYYLKYRYKTE